MLEGRPVAWNDTAECRMDPRTSPTGRFAGRPLALAREVPTLSQSNAVPLDVAYRAFTMARQAARCTPKTMDHYRYTLSSFTQWLQGQGASDVRQITPSHIRSYLIALQERHLKDTTQHAHARGIKAWLNWLVQEGDLDESPMRNVSMPKLEQRIPAPFTSEDVHTLLATCNRKTDIGVRDYAITLTLVDTGLRASEFISLGVGDIDIRTGLATVLGKGQKQRTVRAGGKARSAILHMLATRGEVEHGDPLWMAYNVQGKRIGKLSVHGLQIMLARLGHKAGVTPCSPHRFRRTFALWMLRDGCDLHSLRMLMGHSSLDVLQRYLDLGAKDIERAHMAHSPGDQLLERR